MKGIYLTLTILLNFFLLSANTFAANGAESNENEQIIVSSDFESGSIGEVRYLSPTVLNLGLKNDNDDELLPPDSRDWWYIKLENAPTDEPITITISRRGIGDFYVPVYSYDQQIWHRFSQTDVTQPDSCEPEEPQNCILTFTHQFDHTTVWLAKFYPYTFTDLEHYLAGIEDNVAVSREIIGSSPKLNLPIELLTITDPGVEDNQKKRIWIHARTHPAETGSSFLLEGLLNYLTSDDPTAQQIRSHFIFNIVPMHNVNGVVVGNYRRNLDGADLERSWFYAPVHTSKLVLQAPLENQILNAVMRQWLQAEIDSPPVSAAFNLHSSNEPPEEPVYIFAHFGNNPQKYNRQQRALYQEQVALIMQIARYYHDQFQGNIGEPTDDGGDEFLNEYFPETWWWVNRHDKVIAMTLETVYGTAGFDHWVTQEDMRNLGQALAQGIACYYQVACPGMSVALGNRLNIKNIRGNLYNDISYLMRNSATRIDFLQKLVAMQEV